MVEIKYGKVNTRNENDDRFENRLNTDKVYFNTLNPVWDNEKEDALNVFEMITLLNKQEQLLRSKKFLGMELECMQEVLFDFMNILNKLQANPTDEKLWNVARDMLQANGVVI